MPTCGSHVAICDIPINLNSYHGCSFGCAYCYAFWYGRGSTDRVWIEEGEESLRRFIRGVRSIETNWCDWAIPLHWGTISDPFQPYERVAGHSMKLLRILADDYYPVIISTKSDMLLEPEYLAVLKGCNAVVQVSMVAPDGPYARWESVSFRSRLKMLWKIAPHVRRVIVRVQPYILEAFNSLQRSLPIYAASGVHGITIEGLKARSVKWAKGLGGFDYTGLSSYYSNVKCYDSFELDAHYSLLKEYCHEVGLRFYCAENRLRYLSDSPTCCGCDGLSGFRANTANDNHRPIRYTARMKEAGTGGVFRAAGRDPEHSRRVGQMSYRDAMKEYLG